MASYTMWSGYYGCSVQLLSCIQLFGAGDQPQLIQGIRRRDGLGNYLYAN